MGFSSLFAVGVSAVNAFAKGLEAVSSNIANSQTVGYKRARADFAELIPTGAADLNKAVGSHAFGSGVAAETRRLASEQGAVTRTAESTNLAITGQGFFVVSESARGAASGEPDLYTRAGSFEANAAGDLVNAGGYFLQGRVPGGGGALETVNVNRLPQGADAGALGALTSVFFEDGVLFGRYANGETRDLFEVPLAVFTNAEGLEAASDTAFRNTSQSGSARLLAAGSGAAGNIEGGALEFSTVDIGQEFTTLIATQRAYSSNARIISVADELYQTLVGTAA